MDELITATEINASPRSVWNVLLDFPTYPEWNPFVRSIEGFPKEGETLEVSIQPVGGSGMTFRPKVIRAAQDRELRWLGHVLLPGIFDDERFFSIEPLDGGRRAKIIYRERFTGLLLPLMRKHLLGRREGVEAMNRALKVRVEHLDRRG